MALITDVANAVGVLVSQTPLRGKVDQQTLTWKDASGNEGSVTISFFQSGMQTVTRYDGFDEATAKLFAAAHTVQDSISTCIAWKHMWDLHGYNEWFQVSHAYVSASSHAVVRHMAGRMYSVEVEEVTNSVTKVGGDINPDIS